MWLVVVMMVSTMGISVNTLYCFCKGKYEASLFKIDHHCDSIHEGNDAEDPDLADLPPCCKKAMACHKTDAEKDGCTKRDTKLVKADLKFLEIKKEELPDIQWFIADIAIEPRAFFYTKNLKNWTLKFDLPTRPPPQYFGRKLLNFIQVYRC